MLLLVLRDPVTRWLTVCHIVNLKFVEVEEDDEMDSGDVGDPTGHLVTQQQLGGFQEVGVDRPNQLLHQLWPHPSLHPPNGHTHPVRLHITHGQIITSL